MVLKKKMDKVDDLSKIEEIYYKPNYTMLLNRIQRIKDVRKNRLIEIMLDGNWHSENELVRFAKRFGYIGIVTLSTMMTSLKKKIDTNFLIRKSKNDMNYYKISDNYVGLARAAFADYKSL